MLYSPQVPYYSTPPQYAVDQEGNLQAISPQQLATFYQKQSGTDQPQARPEASSLEIQASSKDPYFQPVQQPALGGKMARK
jgi:hypothetical protein